MRIVWLSSRPPFPLDSGGQIRTYHILRELNRRHDIVLVTLADQAALADASDRINDVCREIVSVPYPEKHSGLSLYLRAALHYLDPIPFVVSKYFSPQLRDALAQVLARQKVDLIVCDYLTPALCLPKSTTVPTVVFEHNVETLIWERLAAQETNWLKRIYLSREAAKMRRFEKQLTSRLAGCIAVSDADSDYFRTQFNVKNVFAVPTGVDTVYFQPAQMNGKIHNPEIVFLGSMDWIPNQEGVFFFCREVLPLIREKISNVSFTVVGRRPPSSILRLAEESDGVKVTGTVDDVRPYLKNACISVVPLRVGGGTRIKIFELMASAVPVVSTAIGAEGLPVSDGRDIVIADEADEMAQACIHLLTGVDLRRRISMQARKLVEENFSWETVGSEFEKICMKLAGAARLEN